MLKASVKKKLNDQVNAEMYSAYLYLSMSAYFESISLKGFANWMKIQAQEEMFHAMKMFNFIIERGEKVSLEKIDAPPAAWKSPLNVFEETLKHEQKVTGLINKIVDVAIKESDHATNSFFQWFVNEQVEEEATADEILQKLKLIGKSADSLFLMDREFGARVWNAPAEKE